MPSSDERTGVKGLEVVLEPRASWANPPQLPPPLPGPENQRKRRVPGPSGTQGRRALGGARACRGSASWFLEVLLEPRASWARTPLPPCQRRSVLAVANCLHHGGKRGRRPVTAWPRQRGPPGPRGPALRPPHPLVLWLLGSSFPLPSPALRTSENDRYPGHRVPREGELSVGQGPAEGRPPGAWRCCWSPGRPGPPPPPLLPA